ncbi:MAG: glycosyltransferase, partial [bacterium]|nr:glycosyltransferase [bacterium]
MDLSIIIVSWNVKDKLRKNLAAIFKSEGDFKFEVLVVDNNSGDGSAAMVAAEFSLVRLIANPENLGFAKANNQGLKLASGKFILLLNPDMRAYPDTLKNILAWANSNPQATVC